MKSLSGITLKKQGMRRKEALLTHSVSGSLTSTRPYSYGAAFGGRYNAYANVLYHTLDAEKSNRIYEYRLMAAFPEVANCIEEYTDNFIWEDERGHVVNLKYTDEDLPEEQVKTLNKNSKLLLVTLTSRIMVLRCVRIILLMVSCSMSI